MGQQTTENQQGSTLAQTPSWLTPYYQGGAAGAESAMGSLPSLTSLYNQVPLLGVPTMNSPQSADLAAAQNAVNNINPQYTTGASGLTGAVGGQNAAMGTLGTFLGTQGTPSSATSAALNEFKQLTAPEIQQSSVLAGLGNSGAAEAALAQGQEQALVPFMQQDLSNTLNAAGTLYGGALQGASGLTQAGLGQESAQQQQIQNALTAAGVPYNIAAQQAQALFNQQSGQFNYAQDIQAGPISGFPNLIGQLQNLSGKQVTIPKL